jgi:exosortase/archaeosortase family protein
VFRWDKVKELSLKSGRVETILGATLIAGDYAFNAVRGSSVGVLDLLVIFVGAVIASYGLKSLRFFWVPVAYGKVLIFVYQIEGTTPNLIALQDWLAGLMASILSAMGISSKAAGEVVSMSTPSGSPILLDVRGGCTGLDGIFAFGLLSTMTLLDIKPKLARLIPIFTIGFVGAFLINILRLLVEFLTYEYAGFGAGGTMHVYLGYTVFIAWVVVFWAIAFRYLGPVQGRVPRPTSMPPHQSDLGNQL